MAGVKSPSRSAPPLVAAFMFTEGDTKNYSEAPPGGSIVIGHTMAELRQGDASFTMTIPWMSEEQTE
jgi:hypothetical protein